MRRFVTMTTIRLLLLILCSCTCHFGWCALASSPSRGHQKLQQQQQQQQQAPPSRLTATTTAACAAQHPYGGGLGKRRSRTSLATTIRRQRHVHPGCRYHVVTPLAAKPFSTDQMASDSDLGQNATSAVEDMGNETGNGFSTGGSSTADATQLLPSTNAWRGGAGGDVEEQSGSELPTKTTSKSFLPSQIPALPTLRQFRLFALPCLGLWVSGPLLSLVDTAFIGLSPSSSSVAAAGSAVAGHSARQLAALGPATTFFDGATYLFAFLNVATTNLYSSALAAQRLAEAEEVASVGGKNSQQKSAAVVAATAKTESVVRTAAQVAMNCGIGIMIFLLVACRPLLRLYIGEKAATTPGLLDSAVDYVSIRALSMPTSLLLGVLQASLLGAKDSVTPLIAILYSTIVNVTGDYLLVRVIPMGLQGAAIATTAAQWASTVALMIPARRKLVADHNLGLWQSKKSPTTTINNLAQQEDPQRKIVIAARDTNNVNNNNNNNNNNNDNSSSSNVTSQSFLAFAAPVLTLILGKLAAFGFMTHSAAAVPGQPTPLAAHQIILSLLFFCSPFLEVISQTAQTFLPPFLAPIEEYRQHRQQQQQQAQQKQPGTAINSEDDPLVQAWLSAAQKVANKLFVVGIVAASVVASITSMIPAFFGQFITSDHVVQQAIKPLARYLWLGAFFWAPVAVSEGVLLARRELSFLALVYLASTALLPPALLQVKFRHGTVAQVWLCFVIFQIFRAMTFTGRIWGGAWLERIKNQAQKRQTRRRQQQQQQQQLLAR